MLRQLQAEEFDNAYEIMRDSFPPNEIRSREHQRALLLKSGYKIYVLKDESAQTIKAFLATYDFDEFLFVEHFAVSKEYRNQGIGSTMLTELQKTTDKPICLEVEEPNTELSVRRIEFYKRNGFFLNEHTYIQPAIEEGKEPIPLKIMSTNKLLDVKQFTKIKKTLYKEVYGVD